MTLVSLKLILTPLLIASATLVARRWGPVVGGWIISLPLTSGPVSVFLALEQGQEFAARAAEGTILGTLAVISFSISYTHASRRFAWPLAVVGGFSGYLLSVAVLTRISLSAVPAAVFVAAILGLALVLEKRPTAKPVHIPAPAWDIPLRMAVATIIVFAITTLSAHLGPALSGIFAAFPAFICIMFAFSHRLCGVESVLQLERGIIIGNFAFVGFFLTVSLTLPHVSLPFVYIFALLAATAVNAAIMAFLSFCKRPE